jgi:hypothetical protein
MSQLFYGFMGVAVGALLSILCYKVRAYALRVQRGKAFDKFWKGKIEVSKGVLWEGLAKDIAIATGTTKYFTPNLDKLVAGKDKITWQGVEYWYNHRDEKYITLELVNKELKDKCYNFFTINVSDIERLLEAQKKEAEAKPLVDAMAACAKEDYAVCGRIVELDVQYDREDKNLDIVDIKIRLDRPQAEKIKEVLSYQTGIEVCVTPKELAKNWKEIFEKTEKAFKIGSQLFNMAMKNHGVDMSKILRSVGCKKKKDAKK